ncbi:MAG: glutamate 5-kinase, partial [Microcystaceae cyanobacterium]
QWGTGGMQTKITAARIATSSGVRTVITQGKTPGHLPKILAGAAIGTQFEPQNRSENARKRWIAFGLLPLGKLFVDEGAVKALRHGGKSLLAAGITHLEGEFDADDAVQICDRQGQEIGRGLVNYSHQEVSKILGCHSEAICEILGYEGPDTVIHRDNLVINN